MVSLVPLVRDLTCPLSRRGGLSLPQCLGFVKPDLPQTADAIADSSLKVAAASASLEVTVVQGVATLPRNDAD